MSSSSSYACNESLLTYLHKYYNSETKKYYLLALHYNCLSFQDILKIIHSRPLTSLLRNWVIPIWCREHKLFLYQTKTSTTTIKNSSSKQILDMANFLLLRHQTSGTTPKFLAGVRQHVPSAYLVLDLNCAKKRERRGIGVLPITKTL